MYCETCGAAHRGRDRLCSECQKTLSGLASPKTTPPGGDFNAAQDPIASGGRKPLSKEGGWGRPELGRSFTLPIALGDRSLKVRWLALFGAAGLAASLAELFFGSAAAWWCVLGMPSTLALMLGIGLMRHRFVRLPHLINVEADKTGRVFVTKIGGDCPVCSGELKLEDIGPKRHTKTVVQCTSDATHQWAFNSKQLAEL